MSPSSAMDKPEKREKIAIAAAGAASAAVPMVEVRETETKTQTVTISGATTIVTTCTTKEKVARMPLSADRVSHRSLLEEYMALSGSSVDSGMGSNSKSKRVSRIDGDDDDRDHKQRGLKRALDAGDIGPDIDRTVPRGSSQRSDTVDTESDDETDAANPAEAKRAQDAFRALIDIRSMRDLDQRVECAINPIGLKSALKTTSVAATTSNGRSDRHVSWRSGVQAGASDADVVSVALRRNKWRLSLSRDEIFRQVREALTHAAKLKLVVRYLAFYAKRFYAAAREAMHRLELKPQRAKWGRISPEKAHQDALIVQETVMRYAQTDQWIESKDFEDPTDPFEGVLFITQEIFNARILQGLAASAPRASRAPAAVRTTDGDEDGFDENGDDDEEEGAEEEESEDDDEKDSDDTEEEKDSEDSNDDDEDGEGEMERIQRKLREIKAHNKTCAPDERLSLLSEHDSPALCDTDHYSNHRMMNMVLKMCRQGILRGSRISGLAVKFEWLRGCKDWLTTCFDALSIDEQEEAREKVRHHRPDYLDGKKRTNDRRCDIEWYHDPKKTPAGEAARLHQLSLKHFTEMAARVKAAHSPTCSNPERAAKDALIATRECKDAFLKGADDLLFALRLVHSDLKQIAELRQIILCCIIQLRFMDLIVKGVPKYAVLALQHMSYNPTALGTSRTAVLGSVLGVGPEQARALMSQFCGDDFEDQIRSPASLINQSLPFVLALANNRVAPFYCNGDGSLNDDDNLAFYADRKCVETFKDMHTTRLKALLQPDAIERYASMRRALYQRVNHSLGREALSEAKLPVGPSKSTDAVLTREFHAINDTVTELDALRVYVDAVFECIEAGQQVDKCVNELVTHYSPFLVNLPMLELLNGTRRGADPERYAWLRDSPARQRFVEEEADDTKAAKAEEAAIVPKEEEKKKESGGGGGGGGGTASASASASAAAAAAAPAPAPEDDDVAMEVSDDVANRATRLLLLFPQSFELATEFAMCGNSKSMGAIDTVREEMCAANEARQKCERDERAAKRQRAQAQIQTFNRAVDSTNLVMQNMATAAAASASAAAPAATDDDGDVRMD
jgi:hypothetical protein